MLKNVTFFCCSFLKLIDHPWLSLLGGGHILLLVGNNKKMIQGDVLSSPVPNSEHASLESGLADSIIIGDKLIFPHA